MSSTLRASGTRHLGAARPAREVAAASRPARPQRAARLRVAASRESERLFQQRLEKMGWEVPLQSFHPLVREAWAAALRVYAAPILETPLEPAPWLKERADSCCVHLKMETRQAAGSFKARGAVHFMLGLTPEQLSAGVYAASASGSHALAVLHAAGAAGRRAGVAARPTIYLPAGASPARVERLRGAGATVVLHGRTCAEAEAEAQRAAAAAGAIFLSSYNDVAVAGGAGTVALELLMQVERGHLDTVYIPVGSGSLAAGMAAVLKAADASIHVVGCQPAASNAMAQSVAAGCVVAVPPGETLSEAGEGGLEEGCVTLEPCIKFVDEWVTVSEEEIARACVDVARHTGVQVEGSTGVAVAAFLKQAPQLRGTRPKHVVIVAAGSNIDAVQLGRCYELTAEARCGRSSAMASEVSRERFARKNEGLELRRAFEYLDKNQDGTTEVQDMIWEVDEDCDGCVNWEEFQAMFERCRDDRAGTEPRQLFNVVQFIIHDKEAAGRVSLEEAMAMTYLRVGRQDSLDSQLEAVFGTSDINSGKTLSLTEFLSRLHASQLAQLTSRPTMRLRTPGSGSSAKPKEAAAS
eukprot:scaffold21.g2147.t1